MKLEIQDLKAMKKEIMKNKNKVSKKEYKRDLKIINTMIKEATIWHTKI